jgi:hypothetical protein
MLWFFFIYIAFQVIFDHWSEDNTQWDVIYFSFQYGWVGLLALYHSMRSPCNKRIYQSIALIMVSISINEITWINSSVENYAMMTTNGVAFGLSIAVIAIFLWYILSKKLQWEN